MALNLLDLKASGERIAARDPDRQTAEIQIRVALMNRFSTLGTAEIVRVARTQRERGNPASGVSSATTPRAMQRVRRMRSLQKFASGHASVHNHFNSERHLYTRQNFKLNRAAALAEWRGLGAA